MHHLPLTLIVGLVVFGWAISLGDWLSAFGVGVIILLRVNAVVKKLAARQDFPTPL